MYILQQVAAPTTAPAHGTLRFIMEGDFIWFYSGFNKYASF